VKKYDIFISLNVNSALKYAQSLQEYLKYQLGLEIFICVDMVGGTSYREQIVDAVESCLVFIPLINKDWADSAECGDEFNFARRTNLTSHKAGRTKPPQPRLPVILPIYFKGFDFLAYKDIRLLASSVNFIELNVNDLQNAWKVLTASILYLKNCGLSITPTTSKEKQQEISNSSTINTDLTHALGTLQNDVSDHLTTGGGTFILTGKTVNDYDGNTTITDRCLLTFAGGRVNGTIDYKPGTLYNTQDVAPIEGTYDLKTGKTQWTEIYHHASSHFEYTGKIDGNSITGTYYWREKPTAVGKFEFKLERWL